MGIFLQSAAGCLQRLFSYLDSYPALWLSLLLFALPAAAETPTPPADTTAKPLTLGLFAYRPKEIMAAEWQPLVNYLNSGLQGLANIELRVLSQPEMRAALLHNELDLIFTNPSHFIELRTLNQLSGALATLTRLENNQPVSELGGVIIRRADRSKPQTLQDLQHITIAAVGTQFLGGYATQMIELKKAGINLHKLDFLFTGGSHDAVVQAVLKQQADAGFIRSSVLESMLEQGKLQPGQLTVVAPREHPVFPFAVSTALYPEWAFVAHWSLPAHYSKRIAALLYDLPATHPAAVQAGIQGFTIPADYASVEELMVTLRMPPFDAAPDFGWRDIWARYHWWLTAGIVMAGAILSLLVALLLNYRRRLHLEKNAHELAERLSGIIDATRAGTWEWNIQTGENRFNERWADILGYTLSELQPTTLDTWNQFVHPDDIDRATEALDKHIRGETSYYACEYRMRHRRGHWVWIYDRGRVKSYTADKQPEWMFGTHIDVTERHELIEAQRQWIKRFRDFSDNVPGVLYQYRLRPDGSSYFPFASQRLRDIYGCSPEQAKNDATQVFNIINADDIDAVTRSIQHSAATLTTWSCAYRINHPQRGLIWVEGSATPSRENDGSIVWHGYIRDITTLRDAQARLRLLASIFDASQEGIFITDANHHLVDINPASINISGYTLAELQGQAVTRLFDEPTSANLIPQVIEALGNKGSWHGELQLQTRDGGTVPIELDVGVVRDENHQITHHVAVFSDISERVRHQKELELIAYYDPLTGIPNRRMLNERLRQAVAYATRKREPLAVCLLDLDNFKPINDTYGHAGGDKVLVEIAQRLSDMLRVEDSVARLGGDEFVLLLMLNNRDSDAVFKRIIETLHRPISLGDAEVTVSASLGISFLNPDAPCDGSELLHQADQATYIAKKAGRDRYAVYQPDQPG